MRKTTTTTWAIAIDWNRNGNYTDTYDDVTNRIMSDFDSITGISFAFDLAPDTPLEIYRQFAGPELSLPEKMEQPYERYCTSFTEWLNKVVEAGGNLII